VDQLEITTREANRDEANEQAYNPGFQAFKLSRPATGTWLSSASLDLGSLDAVILMVGVRRRNIPLKFKNIQVFASGPARAIGAVEAELEAYTIKMPAIPP
jgi:hypothetical protein